MDDRAASELVDRAGAVLDDNWIGHSTKPSPGLYPHQWSWDSAFTAIGNAHRRWDRACDELRRLFEAQWSNGMVPHIVFDPTVRDYFPSAADWGSNDCPAAPAGIATSGLCQPPVHAIAARRVYEARPDATGRRFLAELLEPLRRWHAYLFDVRRIDGELVEIWHPWESGMDNSPAWDAPLAALAIGPDDVPPYRRVDTSLMDPAERPTDAEYDRYVHLLDRLRREHYTPARPATHPFRVHDVLFNAALVAAERDLGRIAALVGDGGDRERARADDLAAAIDRRLWSDEHGLHLDHDAVADHPIPVPIAGGVVALLAEPEHRPVAALREGFLHPAGSDTPVVPSVPVHHELFEPARYWRGPVWAPITWLTIEGLERCGEEQLAARLRRGFLDLVEGAGFAECYDPLTREPCGPDRFSWSASLTVDLVAARESAEG